MPQHSQLAIFAARKNALPPFPSPPLARSAKAKHLNCKPNTFVGKVCTLLLCVCVCAAQLECD